jgi:hypothetical protein
MLTLEGRAAAQPVVPLHVRVASVDGAHYIDLGDETGRVIRIADGTWKMQQPPAGVYFRRSQLTAPLPEPQLGGCVDALWQFVNFTKADRPLILAFLIHALIEPQPHTVLNIDGEHGTGKTSAARILLQLIDPSTALVRKPPKDQEAWITAAGGSWAVAFDNVSAIPDWLSDSLCRASTGEGDVRRKLYSDGDLVVFAFRRVILMTSIDVGAVRGDLADRSLTAHLDAIDDDHRRDEGEFAAEWIEAYPSVLGAFYTLAARVIERLPGLVLESKPRMADFARALAALDEELGTDGLAQYRQRITAQLADSLSADPFIEKLAEAATVEAERSAAAWLQMCEPYPGSEAARIWRAPEGWPANSRSATQHLHRHAPAMRKVGWLVEEREDKKRHVALWRIKAPDVAE